MLEGKMLELLAVALLGGLASILSNKGIAVFNDGLRPILPEFLEGKIGKKELAATSFALSFGLVIGFGIPVSIGATIILIRSPGHPGARPLRSPGRPARTPGWNREQQAAHPARRGAVART